MSIANDLEDKQLEFVIKEHVPSRKKFNSAYWRQGKFYLKDQSRESTITDVKFLSDTLLVVAHRAAAKLYLVEHFENTFTITDTLLLDTAKNSWNPKKRLSGQRFYHPDLMSLIGNTIYFSEYSNRCCVVDVIDNRLVYRETLELGDNAYHGCFSENTDVYLGSVFQSNITIYNLETKSTSTLNVELEPNLRIKTIAKEENFFVLAVDKQFGSPSIKGSKNDAWVKLFEKQNEKLMLLDSLAFPVSQVDGHISYGGYQFVVLHDGTDKTGYIVIIKVDNKKLRLIKKIPCAGFPHGLDIRNDKLIYTTYSQSSIIVINLQDLDENL